MDIFFQDPSEVPLPPAEVRIRQILAEPYPDGRRVKITLIVDPFQKRPNALAEIYNPSGEELAQVSIVEAITRQMSFTMHLRSGMPGEECRLKVTLFYTEPLPDPKEGQPNLPLQMPQSTVVDQAETIFTIPALPTTTST